MRNLAPIILFTYNRPWHTQKALDALADNFCAKESKIYFYCDGAKQDCSTEDISKINQVRQIVKNEIRFKESQIVEQKKNKGLANSIIDGVSEILKKHEKVIVIEDDLVTSKYFLTFMNEALDKYEKDKNVACISGYIYPVNNQLKETFLIKGADCWGWATWRRAWKIFEPDGKILLSEIQSKTLSKEFDFENSYPFTQMLKDQINGKNNSWAIRWYASAFLKNNYCLYPGQSLVQNIGIDGSGTHKSTTDKFIVNLAQHKINLETIETKESEADKKIIADYFRSIKSAPQNFFQRILTKTKSLF